MNQKQIRERVELALQDVENRRWTDTEINQYIDDALVEFTRLAKHPQSEGFATNKSGGTSLGEAEKTGTLAVDGKTATITFSSSHGYSDNDVLHISGAAPEEYNDTFNILKASNTSITFQTSVGEAVTSNSVTVFRVGPVFTKPSNIEEIVSVTLDGRELNIMTESQLNAAAASRGTRLSLIESSMGFHPSPFTVNVNTIDNTPRWREQKGPIEAIIFNNKTANTFRIYPLPKEDKDLYVDKEAANKVFHTLSVRGVPKVSGLTSNNSTPSISSYWHEAIVFGALERALSKESQVQNIEKGQMYRAKFVEQAMQAQKMEGITSGTLSEGRNQGGFIVNRYM